MDASDTPQENAQKEKAPFVKEAVKFALLALLIVAPIRAYVASPFLVNGASMSPTFENGEYLIVDEISYRFEKPRRGDVIVFRYPRDPKLFFIKRVIGLPGERIAIRGGIVTVYNADNPDGLPLYEPYISFRGYGNLDVILEDDEYFVMGDNRAASADSRLWGPLEEEFITGRALVRLFPLSKMDVFPGRASYQ